MKKEKKKEKKASFFSELGGFMKPYRACYAVSVLVSVAGVASGLAAYAFAGMTAAGIFENAGKAIWMTAVCAGICKLLKAVLLNTSTWLSHKAAYRTLNDIREAAAAKMLRMPQGYFEKTGSGRLKNLMTDRIENIEKTLAHLLPEMTADILAPAALVVWMFFIDWRITLFVLLWITAGFSVTSGMMKNYEERYAGQIRVSKSMDQAITEYTGGIEVIKNFGQSAASCEKYKKAVKDYADYNVNWQRETLPFSAMGMAIAPFPVFPVIISGMIFYSHGTLDISSFILLILLSMGIFGPLMQASGYFDQMAQMGTVASEIKTVLDHPELRRGDGVRTDRGDVRFSEVTFSYGVNGKNVLEDISFEVPQGTMLALTGPSGSGKSTIAKLLAGYWDTGSGTICVGGRELADYSQEELNAMIAFVDQDTFLFDRSIRDNIRIGSPEASDEEVEETARKAGCDAFIRNLPDGYDTMAGTAGSRLSGGEKQRIAIARAMMKDAPVMILDEATASADPENEALIQSALSAASEGRTLIIIAHHLSTVINAQQIAYVEDGRIKQIGTHSEMLESSPGYAGLWKISEEGRA